MTILTITDPALDVPADESTDDESVEVEAFEDSEEYKNLQRKVAWKRRGFEFADFILVVVKAALLIVFIAAVTPAYNTVANGFAYNTILSGSMTGTANVGDMVVTTPYLGEELSNGTIVLIENGDTRYLHRIVEVNRATDGSVENYSTQGDANKTRDLFKPTVEDLRGLTSRIIQQPEAGFYASFTLNLTWFESVWKAATTGDWHAFSQLMPYAPVGFLLLVVAVFIFWWAIPDLLTHLRNRALAKYEVTVESLRRTVETHEESLTTIEPVVEELKTDHDAAIAEKAAEEQAFREQQAQAWDAFDPLAPIYDEPEALPAFEAHEFDAHAFIRNVSSRHSATPTVAGSSLDALPALDGSLREPAAPVARSEASAFYIEEEN